MNKHTALQRLEMLKTLIEHADEHARIGNPFIGLDSDTSVSLLLFHPEPKGEYTVLTTDDGHERRFYPAFTQDEMTAGYIYYADAEKEAEL